MLCSQHHVTIVNNVQLCGYISVIKLRAKVVMLVTMVLRFGCRSPTLMWPTLPDLIDLI